MEATEALYGVTMQELGVSKLVSVRFARSGDEAPARSDADVPFTELEEAGSPV
jgi:hypothetical protein